jgi:hypothetical protein
MEPATNDTTASSGGSPTLGCYIGPDLSPEAQYRDPDIDGCGHFRDPKTCEGCAKEKEHDQYIAYLTKMLAEAVGDARRGAANADSRIRELIGLAVYDIEMAEGWEGADALADLKAADRLLRNVERIVRERLRLLKEAATP